MNKPIAFGWYDLEIKQFFPFWDEDLMENKEGCIPLYTHPVKELTDEEIIDLINKHIDYVPDVDNGMKVVGIMEFAKAILRKAQEKC